jgi:hypothetical protein
LGGGDVGANGWEDDGSWRVIGTWTITIGTVNSYAGWRGRGPIGGHCRL